MPQPLGIRYAEWVETEAKNRSGGEDAFVNELKTTTKELEKIADSTTVN